MPLTKATRRVIADNTITNTQIANDAAIFGTKINPNFGTQNILTSSTLTAANIITNNLSATNSISAVNIVASNRLGINVTVPTARLDVREITGATSPAVGISNSGNNSCIFLVHNNTSTTGAALTIVNANSAAPMMSLVNSASGGSVFGIDTGRHRASANLPDPNTTPIFENQCSLQSFGRVLIGQRGMTTPAKVHINANGIDGSALTLNRFAPNTQGPTLTFVRSRSSNEPGTAGAFLKVEFGDVLGGINFLGDDGVKYLLSAGIGAQVDPPFTTQVDQVPGRLRFFTRTLTAFTEKLTIDSIGSVTPGSNNSQSLGSSTLRWSSLWVTGGQITTSDIRQKTNIQSSVLGLQFISKLNPVSYKWTVGSNKVLSADDTGTPIVEPVPGKRTHYGLIAQEVKAVLPENVDFGGWVLTDLNNPDSEQALRYEEFISPIIKAIQELKLENDSLKARIDVLEQRVN